MSSIYVTEQRQKILQKAADKGYLYLEDGLEFYASLAAVSNSYSALCRNGLLRVEPAPDSSDKMKIWEITETGRRIIEE